MMAFPESFIGAKIAWVYFCFISVEKPNKKKQTACIWEVVLNDSSSNLTKVRVKLHIRPGTQSQNIPILFLSPTKLFKSYFLNGSRNYGKDAKALIKILIM